MADPEGYKSEDFPGAATGSHGFLRDLDTQIRSAGIYIHVPFCASRCTYCDFYTLGQGGALSPRGAQQFLEALAAQMVAVRDDIPVVAETLYIGGGTPSLLGRRVAELVAQVRRTFGISDGAEITVEANPDDLSDELLTVWRDAGVTRVSVGIQALDDDVLAVFGRRHTAREALHALELLESSGLRWSADLIAGIPGVANAQWTSWLEALVDAGAHHISVYPLTVEDGTPIFRAIEAGSYPEPDADDAASQMLLAEEVLAVSGVARYEIANFAKPGFEARHNLSYWQSVPYLGLGPSAASMLPAKLGGRVRFTLHDTLEAYLAAPLAGTSADSAAPPIDVEVLTPAEAIREDVMLRMRTAHGVTDELVQRAGCSQTLDELLGLGLVERVARKSGDSWHLTDRGWLLGNEVFSRILFD